MSYACHGWSTHELRLSRMEHARIDTARAASAVRPPTPGITAGIPQSRFGPSRRCPSPAAPLARPAEQQQHGTVAPRLGIRVRASVEASRRDYPRPVRGKGRAACVSARGRCEAARRTRRTILGSAAFPRMRRKAVAISPLLMVPDLQARIQPVVQCACIAATAHRSRSTAVKSCRKEAVIAESGSASSTTSAEAAFNKLSTSFTVYKGHASEYRH
jgi:hypothetical protein